MVEALIDTGFTGFLSLPLSMIESLELPWIFSDSVTLGDGSEVIFQMYRAIVIWDGQFKVVDVAASESEPLLGMSLLYGFKLQIEAVERGTVTIEAMTWLRVIGWQIGLTMPMRADHRELIRCKSEISGGG
jgi:clan AA aspartic protease